MGRQALVTLDHVKAAVEALQVEGRNISSRTVRDKLGNVGSMGTINKLLQQCLKTEKETPSSLRQLPPELQRAVLNFADHYAGDARKQIAEELISCKQDMDDLAEANEQLTSMIDDLRDQIMRTMAEKSNLEGQVAQLTKELSGARDETTAERRAGEMARIELIKLQTRIEALAPLESELRDTREQCEALRNANARAEGTVNALEAQRVALDNQIQYLNGQLDASQIATQKMAEKLEKAFELLDREKERRANAERALAVLHVTKGKRKAFGHFGVGTTANKRPNNPEGTATS